MPIVVGENVGPYRITEKLGRGGMATVFKAYHAALDRYVAIKALHPAFLEDPNFLARFQREARVVAKLEHANIVPIYDFNEHEGRPYLVMKFIEGETLKARLVRDGIARDQIPVIVSSVGEALTYAHNQGILHRDVKPSNVLLANDGKTYLADFGLARIAQAGESTLSGDMMLGTPQYISPEQAMGVGELDEGTDIYSFGVMLYELTVGKVPFSADTPFSIIHDHIYTPLPLPRQINKKIPEALERVLLKALAKERNDRYQDISSVVAAFNQAYSEVDTVMGVAPPVSVSEPATLDPTLYEQESSTGSAVAAVDTPPPPPENLKQKKQPLIKRLRWWQIALLSVAFVFCCLIALAVINENRQQKLEESVPTQTIAAANLEPTEAPAIDLEPTKAPAIVRDQTDRIAAANQNVADNPEDPNAYIELGIAYLATNQFRPAVIAFDKAIAVSGDAADVYLRVGGLYFENEVWIHATQTYLQIFKQFPEHMVDEAMDQFHEAAFMASGTANAEESIPIEAIKEADDILEQVLKARNRLFHATPAEAQEILSGVLSHDPDYPEARLVQSEIHFANNETVAAREYIEGLMLDDGTPFWIKEYIRATTDGNSARDISSVEDARKVVLENPDDPWARLELADALLAAGEFDEVESELTKAFELSGNDPAVYFQAGEILTHHNLYGFAVGMYLTSANLSDEPMTKDTYQKIAQAVYISAATKDAVSNLFAYEAELDPFLVALARVRYTLHHEDREQAMADISALKEQYPDSPEVLLLEAEIFSINGDDATAFEQWETLIKDENAPQWVRNQAEIFIKKFRQ